MPYSIRIRAFFLAIALMMSWPAAAEELTTGEAFVSPTFAELTQAAVMMGAYDIKNPDVVKQYIRLMYCDAYKKTVRDDFAWEKLSRQVRGRITTNREYFRTLYQLTADIQLGAYDFDKGQFPLVENTAFKNIGYMAIFLSSEYRSYCLIDGPGAEPAPYFFPQAMNLMLNQPFNLTGLRVTQAQAQKILEYIKKNGDVRKLYVRFRFKLDRAMPVEKPVGNSKMDFRGDILNIDIFYDRDMTKWVMSLPVSG